VGAIEGQIVAAWRLGMGSSFGLSGEPMRSMLTAVGLGSIRAAALRSSVKSAEGSI
jgi:hypothetical protein